MPDLSMIDACVVKQGVTCSYCHPGLKMTGRMGPSHFTIWVSVPSFSEGRRNRNSRYEIKGVISESFYLAPSPLCFLSTSGESFIHLLLSHVSAQRKVYRALGRNGLSQKLYNPLHLCPLPTLSLFCPDHRKELVCQLPASAPGCFFLRYTHVYPAVCISHKVALGKDMIPPHLPAVTCLVHSKS